MLVFVLLAVLAACGGDDDDDTAAAPPEAKPERFACLDFEASVVDGPNAGKAWTGDLVLDVDKTATDPHNVLATRLATAGVAGRAAFVWLVVAVTRGIRARPSFGTDVVVRAAIVAALVAWFVQSLAHRQSVALDLCAWVLAGLALAPRAWRGAAGDAELVAAAGD